MKKLNNKKYKNKIKNMFNYETDDEKPKIM